MKVYYVKSHEFGNLYIGCGSMKIAIAKWRKEKDAEVCDNLCADERKDVTRPKEPDSVTLLEENGYFVTADKRPR